MAKIDQSLTTYDVVGNREALFDTISNIDPLDTPLITLGGSRNVDQRSFDWQTEFLPAVDKTNAQLEGFTVVPQATDITTRLTNVTQISTRNATVSGSQEAATHAGIASFMAHALANKSKALRLDLEAITCSRQPRVDGNNTTARKTESLPHWIARAPNAAGVQGTHVVGYTTSLPTTATGAFAAVADGNKVQLTEVMFGDAMEVAFKDGARPDTWIASASVRRTISTFEGRVQSQITIGQREVQATVDVLVTDFGTVKVVPSRTIDDDISMIVDGALFDMAYFRPYFVKPLPISGDAESKMIAVEWGVAALNPLGHILFNGIKKGDVLG